MNIRKIPVALILIAVALLAGPLAAQEKVLTPELILTIRQVVDAQLSPDGTRLVYQLARPRSDEEGPGGVLSEIWMVAAGGGEPFRFTYNEKSDRMPQWSPDGRSFAFLSQRGASASMQMYLIRVDGGDAVPLTKAESAVQAFKWAPDGSRIAYTVADPKTKDEQQAEKEGKDWTVADRSYKHTRLFVLDVATKASRLVTQAALTVHDFDWSPDGRRLVLAATDTPLVDDSFMKVKLLVTSADGGEPALLARTAGKLAQPRWSPDGKWIAWLGATAMNDPYAGSLFVVPAPAGTDAKDLPMGENLLRGYGGTATWVGWRPGQPSTLVIGAIERQATALYTIAMADRRREPLFAQPVIVSTGPSFSRDGRLMALVAQSPAHPSEVFFGEAANRPPRRMTTSNPQLAGVALGQQEVVRWKAADGWEIEGVIAKPVGYQPGRRYPTIMQPHGGPEGADLNGWMGTYSRWGQMLAGKGYVTFYPNYRGSIGRGPAFSMGDHRDLMGKEFQDMLAGLDHLVSQGIADPNRIGVGGGSYGGYTSAWAATSASDRFKAAIMWMGISNWYSMTGTSDIFWENSTVHFDAIMYDNFALYWERSPLAHVKKANTPTLIVHGAADPRVPIGQSQEMYTALKWKGVPVEFVSYPREGHGVSEKAHQHDFMTRVVGWFDRYVKGSTISDSSGRP